MVLQLKLSNVGIPVLRRVCEKPIFTPMLVRKIVDENGSAATLAAKRLVGVTPEVNLKILKTANKARKSEVPP